MPLAHRQEGDQMMQENMTGVDKRFSGEKRTLCCLRIRQVLIQIPVCCHAVSPP